LIKIALGTVQFGLDYGVSNISGQVSISEVTDILLEAEACGINTLDTAISYGNSEDILGRVGVSQFNVITKLPAIADEICSVNSWVNNHILSSLDKMNLHRLTGVLMHRSSDFLSSRGKLLFQSLQQLKTDGLIDKIGASIYNPGELDALEGHGVNLDIVQAPFNVLDRRLESSGWLKKLNLLGVEVHTRSVFLQGLLLQGKSQRKPYFDQWTDLFDRFDTWVSNTGQNPLSACLNFVGSYSGIDRVVVGVQSKVQLQEIINSASQESRLLASDNLASNDPLLINPSNWKL